MKVRFEMVVDLKEDERWNDPGELGDFVARLVAPYMQVLKSEARREWYEGEFD